MDRADVALEEFKALRAEIIALGQAQTAIVTVALTATAAIAGIAFGAKPNEGRLQILLALPLVLSGLGLSYLARGYGGSQIGLYIEQELWRTLRKPSVGGRLPSWEEYVGRYRGFTRSFRSVRGWLSFLPGVIIFGAPSAAALIINWSRYAWAPVVLGDASGLKWAWFIDAFITMISLLFLALSARRAQPPPSSPEPSRAP